MFVPLIDVEAVGQAVLRGDRWHHHESALWSSAVFCYAVTDAAPGQGGCPVHNAGYDFNDRILPSTASYFVALARRYLTSP